MMAEALQMYGLSHAKLIDAMRMMTAALNGYIAIDIARQPDVGPQ
ncbi:MAG: hypothetical protein AAF773_21175 [Cyanobacteria bacterium P01_D01_bin.115]